ASPAFKVSVSVKRDVEQGTRAVPAQPVAVDRPEAFPADAASTEVGSLDPKLVEEELAEPLTLSVVDATLAESLANRTAEEEIAPEPDKPGPMSSAAPESSALNTPEMVAAEPQPPAAVQPSPAPPS